MPRPSDPAPGVGRLLVDVSDLLMFLSHHPVVSGIQRVLVEVLPHLDEVDVCSFVAFDQGRMALVELDADRVRAVVARVRDGSSDGTPIRDEVRSIRAGLGGQREVHGAPGDVLAILGAGWSFPGLFRSIRRLKEDGVAVVVLLYDLIPVVFPGFPAEVVQQFREYLPRVAALADRAPAISAATRRDFETYCARRGWPVPGGAATGLAGDQWSAGRLRSLGVDQGPAWPRPFVVFVSTIEVRKNHILALQAWQRLIEELGADRVPDLVCVGRLGWNAFEFLAEYRETEGLGGRVHLLTESLPDARLAALYRDCEFTVYPSRYEGWGLPVGESLDMGKPVVAARNSSLPEVGGDLAAYFDDDDLDGFVAAVRRYVTDRGALARDAERISREHRALTWPQVADALHEEIEQARAQRRRVDRSVELGVEYGLVPLAAYRGEPMGQSFLDFLDSQRLPLTGQHMGIERGVAVDMVVDAPRRGDGEIRIGIQRPAGAQLHMVLSTSRSFGSSEIEVAGPTGRPVRLPARQGVVSVPLGGGDAGELAWVVVSAPRRGLGPVLRSFVVVEGAEAAEQMVRRGPVVRQTVLSGPGALRIRRALSGGPREVAARLRRRGGL